MDNKYGQVACDVKEGELEEKGQAEAAQAPRQQSVKPAPKGKTSVAKSLGAQLAIGVKKK